MRRHVFILSIVALLPLLGLLCYCPFAAHASIQRLSEHLHNSGSSGRLYAPYYAVRTADWFGRALHLSIGYDAAICWFYALPILIFLPSSFLLLLGVSTKAHSYFIAAYVALLFSLPLLTLFLGILHPSFPLRHVYTSPNQKLQRTAFDRR